MASVQQGGPENSRFPTLLRIASIVVWGILAIFIVFSFLVGVITFLVKVVVVMAVVYLAIKLILKHPTRPTPQASDDSTDINPH